MNFALSLIGIAVFMALFNVCVPYGAWGFGAHNLSIGEREFIRRYDLLSPPRLAIGGFTCLAIAGASLFPRAHDWLGMVGIVCSILFGVLALYDTLKATKGAWVSGNDDPREQS